MIGFLSIVWDVDPEIFSIGKFSVRYYGLAWALTFAVGMWMFIKFVKKDGYPPKVFDSVFWYGVLSTVIGARLGHCLFYDPAYYLSHPLEILYVWQGGMASHGAALGLLLGLWLFSRKNKIPYIWSLDRIMLPVTIGGAMVRLGNLMNSEIYGVATDKPWGFIFVKRGEILAKHPTQIYEALAYLITFLILMWLYYRKDAGHKRPGLMFGVGLLGVFVSRFVIEYVKEPQEVFEQGWLLLMGQWLSIPFIILGIWMIVRGLRQPKIDAQIKEKSRLKAEKSRKDVLSNVRSLSSSESEKKDKE